MKAENRSEASDDGVVLSIGQLAAETGVTAETIRYYAKASFRRRRGAARATTGSTVARTPNDFSSFVALASSISAWTTSVSYSRSPPQTLSSLVAT
jgi:hypothetical protein